jgi:hypothetical protein
MKTYLPVGTWIEYRHNNQMEMAEIIEGDDLENKHIKVFCTPPHGITIHIGVWKDQGNRFVPYKTRIYNAPR